MEKKVIAGIVILIVIIGASWWFFLSPEARLSRCAELSGPDFVDCLGGVVGRDVVIGDCPSLARDDLPVLYSLCVSELVNSVSDCSYFSDVGEKDYCQMVYSADVSSCASLPSVSEQFDCEDAIRVDIDCSLFQGRVRDDCFFNKAEISDDCSVISDVEYQTRCMAIMTKDISLCPVSDNIEKCETALFSDIEICALFSVESLHDQCVLGRAKVLNDCASMFDSKMKIYCQALVSNDASKCNRLPARLKTSCLEVLS